MSKSMGNGIAPAQIVEQYGADVLRLWVASIDYFEDVRFGNNIMKQTADNYRKIRNTLRYLLGRAVGLRAGPRHGRAGGDGGDRSLGAGPDLQRVVAEVNAAGYDAYEFQRVSRAILDFCATDLSAFYLDALKDRLYASAPNDSVRRSSQTALYEIASVLIRALAPILPHTAEEAWQLLPGATETVSPSVELTVFPEADPFWMNDDLAARWAVLLVVRDDVNKALENAKTAGTLKKGLEAAVTLGGATDDTAGWTDEELATLLLVSQVERRTRPPDRRRGRRRAGREVRSLLAHQARHRRRRRSTRMCAEAARRAVKRVATG